MIEHQSLNHQSLGLSSCSNRSHILAQRAIQDVTLEAPVLAANHVLENDTGIRHAAGRLFSERGERQEYVLVGGRRNRVFGDKEVNGSCGTATKRFFLQPR
jgi:hypothetical protein